MSDTNASTAPWYIVDASDRKWAELQVLETMVSNIEVAMQNQAHSVPILQNVFPLEQIPHLADIDLKDETLDDEEYKTELKELQSKLGELHNKLYRKRIPVIITYEGWDAAGKGGNFGGGMKCGSTCGAITAGLMILGAKGIESPFAVNEFRRRIAEKHDGMTDCAELLRANAQKGGAKKPHCDNMIFEAIELIDELTKEAE